MAYSVGHDIDAQCNKCKMELAHVIVAMVEGRPKRVQCKTCAATHNYKSASDAKATAKRAARKAKSTKRSATAVAGDYDTLMQGRDIASAARYRISEEFDEGLVVDHKKFGLGLVLKRVGEDKIEVIFRDGVKTLIHARKAS
ncbi:MAG: hypothetical protein AAF658_07760 [Myxococcota bacterium]